MTAYIVDRDDGRYLCRYIGEDGKRHDKSFGRGEEGKKAAEDYCDVILSLTIFTNHSLSIKE